MPLARVAFPAVLATLLLAAAAAGQREPKDRDQHVKPEPRIHELRTQIRQADHEYYNLGNPHLTDAQYDALMLELQKLEREHPTLVTPDSPTQRVGAPLQKGTSFATSAHLAPMGSIESLMSGADLDELFNKRHRLMIEVFSTLSGSDYLQSILFLKGRVEKVP